MDTWDSEPSTGSRHTSIPVVQSKWADEDADEDVVDSWDQEPDEDVVNDLEPVPATAPTKKNHKKIGEKYEEKEKRRKLEAASRTHNDEEKRDLTPGEILAEKLAKQKLQEESDLCIAKEVFGVISATGLESKEDFDKFKEEILKLVTDCAKNSNYYSFTEDIVHSLCIHLSSIEIKKIYTWLGNLHIEKSKREKGDKVKKNKGKGKAKLKMEGDNDYSEYTAYTEDYDDFI